MNNQLSIEVISKLPAYFLATKFSTHFPVLGNAEHIYADQLGEKILEYWDEITEDLCYVYERIRPEQQISYQLVFEDLPALVESLQADIIDWRERFEEEGDSRTNGIRSLLDDFLHVVNQLGYRASLS